MPIDTSERRFSLKEQTDIDTPASGSGATQILLEEGSPYFSHDAVQITDPIATTSKMAGKARSGLISVDGGGLRTRLGVGMQDAIFQYVLGGDWEDADTFDQSDFTSLAISGSGATLTAGGGSFLTEGIRAGMVITLAGMTETENNGVPILIVSVNSATQCTIQSLTTALSDETADTSFTLTRHRYIHTPAVYDKRFLTIEDYFPGADVAVIAEGCLLTGMTIAQQANAYASMSFGIGGRSISVETEGGAPIFTDPALVQRDGLMLIDGGLWVRSGSTWAKKATATAFEIGLQSNVGRIGLLHSRLSPGVSLANFQFSGSVTVTVEDGADLEAAVDEDEASLNAFYKEANSSHFLNIFAGHLSYGPFQTAEADGFVVGTAQLNGGRDTRGTGYADTTLLISESTLS